MASEKLDGFIDEFLKGYFHYHPTHATALGFHQHDSRLEDCSTAAINEQTRWLEAMQAALDPTIEPSQLDTEARADFAILKSEIAAMLLSLQTIKPWANDPSYYSDLASWSVYSLLVRDFAPVEQRMNSAAARLAAIPALFEQAKVHLSTTIEESHSQPNQGVPRIFVEIALEEFKGTESFFETVVPQFAEQARGAEAANNLLAANARALDACRRMIKFLSDDLLERSDGDFALGAETFQRLLQHQEHVQTPIADILERGWRELRDTQTKMRELAGLIDKNRPLEELLRELAEDHPSAGDLIASYKSRCDEIKRFVIDRDLVTIPDGDELQIVETPPFCRSLIFAALDPPGAFETKRLPTFFYVTPADTTRTEAEQNEYLKAHSNYSQAATIIHEAYPGHHVQFLHLNRTPSRLRKIFMSGTFVEGWAHYCEEMALDEGFGDGDPKLRLFQWHEAIWRIGRLIAATKMHTSGYSMDEAIDFLVRECFQERDNARREVWRYTRDPLVLIYSWGKWQIQALRDECRRRWGAGFSLKRFHDQLLGQGEPPLSIIRSLVIATENT